MTTVHGHSVLLVDDDDLIQQAHCRMLRYAGFRVTLAHDGIAALAAWESERFDVTIADLQLPRMSGLELLAQIRARDVQALVILLVRSSRFVAAADALMLGAHSVLKKPVTQAELIGATQAACALRTSRLRPS